MTAVATQVHVNAWLGKFLVIHAARYPHDWPDAGADPIAFAVVNGDFRDLFEAERVTEEEAHAASRALLVNPPRFRPEHLPKLIAVIRKRRSEASRVASRMPPSEDYRRLRAESVDCPECRGQGIVSRPAWCPPWPRVVQLTLACRCSLGRHRLANAISSEPCDLQAHPALWTPGVNHPTWSRRPTPIEPHVADWAPRGWFFVNEAPDGWGALELHPRRFTRPVTTRCERREPTSDELARDDRRRREQFARMSARAPQC